MDHMTIQAVRKGLNTLGLGVKSDPKGFLVFCLDRRVSTDTILCADAHSAYITGIRFADKLKKEKANVRAY